MLKKITTPNFNRFGTLIIHHLYRFRNIFVVYLKNREIFRCFTSTHHAYAPAPATLTVNLIEFHRSGGDFVAITNQNQHSTFSIHTFFWFCFRLVLPLLFSGEFDWLCLFVRISLLFLLLLLLTNCDNFECVIAI